MSHPDVIFQAKVSTTTSPVADKSVVVAAVGNDAKAGEAGTEPTTADSSPMDVSTSTNASGEGETEAAANPSEDLSGQKDSTENVETTAAAENVEMEPSATEGGVLEPPVAAEMVYEMTDVSTTTFVDDGASQEVAQETVVTTTKENEAEGCSGFKRVFDGSTVDGGAAVGDDVDDASGAKKLKLDSDPSAEN